MAYSIFSSKIVALKQHILTKLLFTRNTFFARTCRAGGELHYRNKLLQICKVDKDFSQIAGIPLLEIFTVLSLQLLLTYAMKELPVASGMQFRVSNRKDSKLLLKSEAAL